MKYLQDYIQDKQTALFKECKAFFAFNNDQFFQGLKEHNIDKSLPSYGVVSMGHGMYVKKGNSKKLVEGLDAIHQEGMKQDIADHGLERIIRRELDNHEYVITRDITDTWEAIKDYPGIKKKYVERIATNHGYKIPQND